MIHADSLARFFASPIGKRLRGAQNVLREFKFSILDEGSGYQEELAGEYVLLQGVVDCAIVDADGIVLIDFKTDRVTDETVERKALEYTPQVHAYADALARIFGLPVREKYLYFFRTNQFIPV